ncbi:MAG: Gx transporter family protein [Clostridia bacterium]|nr:Gx transporter family protein [Clostridia bacterium]
MSSKQGNNRNRIKRLAIYSLLCSLCIVFGYVEFLIPTSLIAPGIKLGISNSIAILLLINGDIGGAFAVNISRILLSALLFGSPFSLLFSLCAGIVSTLVCALLIKLPALSPIGVSVAGGVCHNAVQVFVASFVVGRGVWFYLPILTVAGVICGAAIGFLGIVFSKKAKIDF